MGAKYNSMGSEPENIRLFYPRSTRTTNLNAVLGKPPENMLCRKLVKNLYAKFIEKLKSVRARKFGKKTLFYVFMYYLIRDSFLYIFLPLYFWNQLP
jgi:hypothetical protein